MTIYSEIGVRPFINARAPHTRFGGSIMPAHVVDAMAEASRTSVEMDDLQAKIGTKLAQLTRNEAAFISCGAASGISLAIAACMTGTDPSKCARLPDTTGMKNKVVIHKAGRFDEDICIQVPGVKVVEIGSRRGAKEQDLLDALDADTAAVLTCNWQGLLPVSTVTKISHAANVPVIVDAAGEVPPIENFWHYTQDCNADAVVISGGKGLRGPQATGLVLGRREIIDGCIANANPNRGIGRTMKVAKEEMVGLYAAVRHLLEDPEAELSRSKASAQYMIEQLKGIPGLEITRDLPFLLLGLDRVAKYTTDQQVMTELRDGEPSILALCRNKTLWVNVTTLQPGEDALVAHRVTQILS